MFQQVYHKSKLHTAVSIIELIYHATVRDVRKAHGNALMAIGLNILQALVFLAAFYVMFSVLGTRYSGCAVRRCAVIFYSISCRGSSCF